VVSWYIFALDVALVSGGAPNSKDRQYTRLKDHFSFSVTSSSLPTSHVLSAANRRQCLVSVFDSPLFRCLRRLKFSEPIRNHLLRFPSNPHEGLSGTSRDWTKKTGFRSKRKKKLSQ